MASGGIRKVNKVVAGTGAQLDVKGFGFRPNHVVIVNLTSLIRLEWHSGLPDASGIKQVQNGDGTYVTSAGITPLADGVRIGTDSVNGSAENLSIICTE